MKNTTLKPPYPSTGQADEILDIFRRISPKKIDSTFVAENKIATAPNASSVVNFTRWMRITDSENNVIPEVAIKLRMQGDQRNKFIQELIKTSYKEVFDQVHLQEANRDDLFNFFIHTYNYGPAPAKLAGILLLHLCEKYGIPISDELKKKSHQVTSSEKKEKKRIQGYAGDKKGKADSSNQKSSSIPEGAFRISIDGNGLSKDLIAHNKEELEAVYIKFKDFITAAKHLFPESKSEEEQEDNLEL